MSLDKWRAETKVQQSEESKVSDLQPDQCPLCMGVHPNGECPEMSPDQVNPVSFVTDEMVDKAWEVFDGSLRPVLEAAAPLLFAKRDAEIRARVETEIARCKDSIVPGSPVVGRVVGLEFVLSLLTEGGDGE